MKHAKFKISLILLGILLLISALAAWEGMQHDSDGILIHVIDVGQADCMVIETDSGNIMIDTGTDISEERLRAYLCSHGLREFSYLILSHPHDDHIGNADMILKEFKVDRVLCADCTSQDAVWNHFMSAMEMAGREKGTEWIKPVSGTVCYVGRLRLEVLMAPLEGNGGENKDSLIVRAEFGSCSMLLTGDADADEEEQLLAAVPAEKLKADFLKVAHHGSSGSSTETFLQAVSPRCAVISCGVGNSFSHPHEEVLNRLREENAEIYRTDLSGSLIFFCDGTSFSLKTLFVK